MAKLTNKMIEVLSERVVDILEEQHNIAAEEIKKSSDYINFNEEYYDDILMELSSFQHEFNEYRRLQSKIEDEAKRLNVNPDVYLNSYAVSNARENAVTDAIESYLDKQKKKKFPTISFDRDKMLRKIQADILLSEVGNPEEIVKQTTAKYGGSTPII